MLSQNRDSVFAFEKVEFGLFLDEVYSVEVSSFLIPEKQLWKMAT